MATAPLLPDGEELLDEATRNALLSNMGEGMVLVGGQALAFWMARYGMVPQEVTVSNDGDVLGQIAEARRIAGTLNAALLVPDPRALTSLVAQIRVPAQGGNVRNIDVLHMLYTVDGLRKSADFTRHVVRHSVNIELDSGAMLRVMHPLDLLESRLHNAAGLLWRKVGTC